MTLVAPSPEAAARLAQALHLPGHPRQVRPAERSDIRDFLRALPRLSGRRSRR